MTQRTTETQHREPATRNRDAADVQELFCRVLHHTTAEHKPGLQNNGAGVADPPTKGRPGDPVTPPIVLSGVFFLPGDPAGPYQYARWSNPTWTALEEALSILEDAETVIFPSGMATVAAVLSSQLKPGDRILLPSDAYYTSRVLADKYLATAGVRVATCPSADYDKQAIPGPFETWLVHRGLETLEVRFERMCNSAEALAARLAEHSKVNEVKFPGLRAHPAYTVAKGQMLRFGMILGVTLSDKASAERFIDNCRVIRPTTSFGGLHTSAERRARWGDKVPEGFVRVSVGCEPLEQLWKEMKAALDSL